MTKCNAFSKKSLSIGLVLVIILSSWAAAQDASLEERNKATVRLLKESQITPETDEVNARLLAPNYDRQRGGFGNLAANANGQDFPSNGKNLRGSFPDRTDTILEMIAEGDRVGMLFKVEGTHKSDFFGIPATGRVMDVFELGTYKLANGQIIEARFMADEEATLKQLRVKFPIRKDGDLILPKIRDDGEAPDALLNRLLAMPQKTQADRNKIAVVRSMISPASADVYAVDYRLERAPFQHLVEYGRAHSAEDKTLDLALSDRHDKIDFLIAEDNIVWVQYTISGINTNSIYGLSVSNNRVGVTVVGILRLDDGKLKEGWFLGDGLGLLQQLGVPSALVE